QSCRLLLNLIQHVRSPRGARLLLHEHAPFHKISTEGDPRVPAPHPLLSHPYRTMPPLLAAIDIPAVGSTPISKDTTCPATLHETMIVQGNQVGIRSRHYASFALGNASNPGRGTCCHANGLGPV